MTKLDFDLNPHLLADYLHMINKRCFDFESNQGLTSYFHYNSNNLSSNFEKRLNHLAPAHQFLSNLNKIIKYFDLGLDYQ